MPTVPLYALPRSETRWLLVRGDLDSNGSLHRSGIAHLVHKSDGRWEWRACGQMQVVATREAAEDAVQAVWLATAPADAPERCCIQCGQPLPPGSTSRRRFCVPASCRVRWNRAKNAAPDSAIRVRRRTNGPQAGRAVWRALQHALAPVPRLSRA